MRRHTRESEKRRKLYLAVFIILVMVSGSVGFIGLYNSDDGTASNTDYNGFSFSQDGNQWVTEVDGDEYQFSLHPQQIPLFVPRGAVDRLDGVSSVTLVFDPAISDLQYVDLARFELRRFFLQRGVAVQQGITAETDNYPLSVITCVPGEGETTITFIEQNESGVFTDQNCITIAAQNPVEHIGFAERIMYMVLGVMR
jgi:hypothetical protein